MEIHAPKFTLKYFPGAQKSVFTGKQNLFALNEQPSWHFKQLKSFAKEEGSQNISKHVPFYLKYPDLHLSHPSF